MQTGMSNCNEYLMRGRNISPFNLHQHKEGGGQSDSANSTECPSLPGYAELLFKLFTIKKSYKKNTQKTSASDKH